ncbi:branchpoint-bridging protein [Trichoderma asperellum]|uniref:Branchpoint-bridging protein n=1 Tax=Trichoderma asperellum TaxID=101201 RepID=A0A6V8R3M9_TRIAP|nr:branchpoint-bridging protein [Trichoderma asperellum]
MSWRNQGITGSNNIPLGKARHFGAEEEDGIIEERDLKRGRDPEPRSEADGPRRRKKRNRWGDASENKAAGLMGLPTAILSSMTSEQLEAYTLHLRIEEISQKLRIDDVVPADGDRSPSPPPQYDNHGRRINTREYRYRKRLEDERHKLVEKAMKTIPNYHPPQDYRRPTKTQEKVYVPVNDYPEINFIGLLIGPRGNTLKKMENDSGAKIAIRGKGSVKEGKGRSDAAHSSNQEEDLHCLIMADTEEKVNKAKQLIHNVIETVRLFPNTVPHIDVDVSNMLTLFFYLQKAASIPEGQNELKRNQLRELAALNGTLRDDENQACQNCASSAEFVAMPATWLGIVQTASEAPIGVMTRALALQVGSEVAMPSTVKWSNSCRNLAVAQELPLRKLKPAQAATTTTGTAKRSHGREDQPVDLHPGDPAIRILTKEAVGDRHLGLVTAIAAMITATATAIATAMVVTTTTMDTTTTNRLPQEEEEPLGISRLNTEPRNTKLLEWVGIPTMLRMAHTALHRVWARLLVSLKSAALASQLLRV